MPIGDRATSGARDLRRVREFQSRCNEDYLPQIPALSEKIDHLARNGGPMNDLHLQWLLTQAKIAALKQDELINGLRSKVATEVAAARQEIAEVLGPTKLEELEFEWSFTSGRAVLLWSVESLRSKWQEIEKATCDALRRHGQPDKLPAKDWVPASRKPRTLAPRVARISINANGLHAIVVLVEPVSLRQEDEIVSSSKTVEVELMVPKEKPHVVRAFANEANAKEAIKVFLKWLLRIEVPSGRSARDFFVPVKFGESDVRALKFREKWGNEAGMRGDDPTNRNGKCEFNGKEIEDDLEELDFSDTVVKHHAAAPRDERMFNFSLAHPDGFTEKGRVNFVIRARHPHVQFRKRSSRFAIEHMVDALLATIAL